MSAYARWEIERNLDLGNIYIREVSGRRGRICRMWNDRTSIDDYAALIAAAPELLEALKLALTRMAHNKEGCMRLRPSEEWDGVNNYDTSGCRCAISVVRAAIAKAEGK